MNVYWYDSGSTESSYLLIFKNGSTSIRHAMGHVRKVSTPGARAFTKLRDPYERSVSIYNEMVKQGHASGSFQYWLEQKWEHGFTNVHEYAQTHWLELAKADAPDIRIFTTFEQVEAFLGRPIPHRNRSQRFEMTEHDRAVISELYADDIKLWNNLNQSEK